MVSNNNKLEEERQKLDMAFMKFVLGILVVGATCFARNIEDSKGKTFPPFTVFDDHHGQYVRVTGKSGACNLSPESLHKT